MERISDEADEKIRYAAVYWFAARYLNQGEYEKARDYLDRLPDLPMDKTILQTRLLLHEKEADAAAVYLEGNLLQTIVKVQSYLYKLLEIEEEAGDHQAAEGIARIADEMCALFGLWDYGAVVPHLLLALYRKDADQSIQLIEKALIEAQKSWDMSKSPLYHRYPRKSFEQFGKKFMPPPYYRDQKGAGV